MAHFGGKGGAAPWGQPRQQQQQASGLIPFGNPLSAVGQPVFQQQQQQQQQQHQGQQQLAAAVQQQQQQQHGGPAVTLATLAPQQVNFARNALGNPFGGGVAAAQHLLQQQQAAAAVVGALQQHHHHQQQQQHQQHGPPGPGQSTQRVFTGTVTKMHDNFGFVDENVFFQTSVVKGEQPRVQDRVLVEAVYNPNMPFKWNATRIQVLPSQQQQQQQHHHPPPQQPQQQQHHHPPPQQPQHHQQHQQPPPQHHQQQQQQPPHRSGQASSSQINPSATPNSLVFGGPPTNRNKPPSMRNEMGGGPPLMDHPRMGNLGNNSGHSGPSGPPPFRGSMRDNKPHNEPPHRSKAPPRDEGRSRDRSSRERRTRGSSPASIASSSRKRSRSPRTRTRSKSRSRSPPRRRTKTSHRHNISLPKVSLFFPQGNVYELKKRYANMYVPSDFFSSKHSWALAFPVDSPFKIRSNIAYHVFDKEKVMSPTTNDAILDPPDADHAFVAKVMLLACPTPQEIFEKTCPQPTAPGERGSKVLVHATRLIKFLVGVKGKNETLAIGGPWSPSLDGKNPGSDPSVLVRTAIRTCKALTGIDLNKCSQWHRFLEVHYRRSETSTKPARTETTVIFLPDIWSLMPTPEEYEALGSLYNQALEARINPPTPMKTDSKEPEDAGSKGVSTEETGEVKDEKIEETEERIEAESKDEPEMSADGENKIDEGEESKPEPTHWKELDLKTMKVNELREELLARGVNSKGLKAQLVGRLQKCLKEEEEKESEKGAASEEPMDAEGADNDKKASDMKEKDNLAEQKDDTSVVKRPTEETKPVVPIVDEKEKMELTSKYKLPSNPCIPVHPSPKAKSGKFSCSVNSLSVLLDYRPDDNKEGTFEVSLFAELFNEMMMRDSGFSLYKAIVDESKRVNVAKEEQKEKGDEEVEEVKSPKKSQMVTVNKELLEACSYFDLSHSGSFEAKDVEELMLSLGLDLSRSYVKKLLLTVLPSEKSTEKLDYRKLSDKPEDEAQKMIHDESTLQEQTDLAKKLGNGFKTLVQEKIEAMQGSDSAKVEDDSTDEALCTIKGVVVSVNNLLERLEKCEAEKCELQSRWVASKKAFEDLKANADRQASLKEKLTMEVRDLRRKVRSLEDDSKRSSTETMRHMAVLKDIFAKVSPIVNTVPKGSSSSSKSSEVEVLEEVKKGNSDPKGAANGQREEKKGADQASKTDSKGSKMETKGKTSGSEEGSKNSDKVKGDKQPGNDSTKNDQETAEDKD